MAKQKTKKILNYQVIIYPDKIEGSNKNCFTAYCPALEVADSGATIEQSLTNIKGLIGFHLECLKKESSVIPQEFYPDREEMITFTKVSVPLYV
jgi:predicted RNase H-like HicB family nuclease